jgi:hypothetical protein
LIRGFNMKILAVLCLSLLLYGCNIGVKKPIEVESIGAQKELPNAQFKFMNLDSPCKWFAIVNLEGYEESYVIPVPPSISCQSI